MASVACCLLSGQGVFWIDLCPAGEKRVKFEEVHVYILHSPPVLGGWGVQWDCLWVHHRSFQPKLCRNCLSISSIRESIDLLFRGFETGQEPVGPVFSTTQKCPLQLREFRRPEGLI